MLQSLLSRSALVFLSVTLTLLSVACTEERDKLATQNKQKLVQSPPREKKSNSKVDSSSSATQNNTDSQATSQSDASLEEQTEISFLEEALDKAAGASNIGETALSRDDWLLVVAQYQDAIALLRKIRQQSKNYTVAQTKIAEYQSQIKHARQQASLWKPKDVVVSQAQKTTSEITDFDLPPVIPESEQAPLLTIPGENYPQKQQQLSSAKPLSPTYPQQVNQQTPEQQTQQQQTPKQKVSPQLTSEEITSQRENLAQQGLEYNKQEAVFTVPIKRRVGGTPVIEVNFNGNRQFEMIVDTGASGTVITQKMAKSLGVKAVGKAQANTASAKAIEFPVGYVDSMEAAGVQVNQVAVAIGGKELEVGLLGHDFFGNYDLTIKRNVVELRPQSQS